MVHEDEYISLASTMNALYTAGVGLYKIL